MRLHTFSKFLQIVAGLVALCFLAAAPTYAQVVINEVHPAPSTGSDWVELYNTGNTAVDLNGWKLEDQLTSPSTISSWATATSLAADGYLVVEVSNKLNNAADGVTLKNSAGQILDQMNYSGSTTDQSWARQPNGTGSFVLTSPTRSASNPSPLPTPTPSPSPSPTPTAQPSPTPTPSPTPQPSPTPAAVSYPATLILSEIMACPETGQEEWIELYNPDATPYTLANWQLRDSSNNVKTINTTLAAHGYTVIPFTSAWLNNDGDSLTLTRPDSVILFTEQFGACTKGNSLIKIDDTWQNTTQITKGSSNPASETAVTEPSSVPTTLDLPLTTSQSASQLPAVTALNAQNQPIILDTTIEASPQVATPGGVLLQVEPSPTAAPVQPTAKLEAARPFPLAALASAITGLTFLALCAGTSTWLFLDLKRAGFQFSDLTPDLALDPLTQPPPANPFS